MGASLPLCVCAYVCARTRRTWGVARSLCTWFNIKAVIPPGRQVYASSLLAIPGAALTVRRLLVRQGNEGLRSTQTHTTHTNTYRTYIYIFLKAVIPKGGGETVQSVFIRYPGVLQFEDFSSDKVLKHKHTQQTNTHNTHTHIVLLKAVIPKGG